MNTETKYKKAITSFLDCTPAQIFLFWKGRVGLYAALKAIGVGKDDEVIVQAFTCVVVPNAIIYSGATPIYTDVQPDTYNTSFEEIKSKVTSKTKVIITQNTFGLSSDVAKISAFCAERGIICIEDCTHGFGGRHDGKSNGSFADFAFYSTQWNKPFSTGIGGILRVNNKKYLTSIQEIVESACLPTPKEKLMLNALIKARKHLLNDASYWALKKVYRQLSAWRVVVGSSSPEEIETPKLPDNFLKKGCKTQFQEGIQALSKLVGVLERRNSNARKITALLKREDKKYVSSSLEVNHSFLIYPILVNDRAKFLSLSEKAGLPMGDWFVSPLHPVTQNFELWNLDLADFPVASQLSGQIVNIPLDREDMKKYLSFLENHLDSII